MATRLQAHARAAEGGIQAIGVALGACAEGVAVTVRRLVESWHAHGGAQIHLGGTTTPAPAVLANGTMAHCLDCGDARTQGAGHTSAVTCAAAQATRLVRRQG